MSTQKNFTSALAETISDLAPASEMEKKPIKYIRLRLDLDVHEKLRNKAHEISMKSPKNYSLTDLINDILKKYIADLESFEDN